MSSSIPSNVVTSATRPIQPDREPVFGFVYADGHVMLLQTSPQVRQASIQISPFSHRTPPNRLNDERGIRRRPFVREFPRRLHARHARHMNYPGKRRPQAYCPKRIHKPSDNFEIPNLTVSNRLSASSFIIRELHTNHWAFLLWMPYGKTPVTHSNKLSIPIQYWTTMDTLRTYSTENVQFLAFRQLPL